MNNKSGGISDIEIGVSGTTQWRTCGLYPNTTLAIYFEVISYTISASLQLLAAVSSLAAIDDV